MRHCNLEEFDRPGWEIVQGSGPIMATAVHAGHEIKEDLTPLLAADPATRRREEDPMTGIWASVGDQAFRSYTSRFQADLNRARDKAIYLTAEDAWGIEVWKEPPPEDHVEMALADWDDFYAMMARWIEHLIGLHGTVVLLDIHSYNHRRDGPFAHPAPQDKNPDIDLGVTTTDLAKFGNLVDCLTEKLAATPAAARKLDVRHNARYPDGGHWPEWVFDRYGDHVATITLEYKKFYMDEWTGNAFLPVVEDLRGGLSGAVAALKKELGQ